ncbi:MAG TPA: cbb3-type cytochrome oxidase assembly protein CcoS [Albidovulum sp.]|uniref:cbb3-type cytochrome oxidase assembly protein CcoS n=1 Tax=Albidovulum sp. TaxID=1872424 RepID=UPI002C153F38|nr:cbb3-type cytochrome oxidase assembly protein CcoS [Albidovulum sp.]
MSTFFLIPLSILMGLVALGAFIWALRSGQYDDPEGDAWRPLSSGPQPAPDKERRGGA